MCTELLPPGGYPIAVKYIISYHKLFLAQEDDTKLCSWWFAVLFPTTLILFIVLAVIANCIAL
jgi:hypothetical protein